MKKKKMSSGEEQVSLVYFWWIWLRIFVRKNIFERFRKFKARRPHRNFRLTRRRDYVRPLKIAGYWSFTKGVFRLIFGHKKTFFSLIALIAFSNFLLVGLLDQDFLTSLNDVIESTSGGFFSGGWGEVGKVGLIVVSTFSTGGLVQSPSESQQIAMILVVLFSWLAVVQLCRNIYSGRKNILIRDILYSCGAPIIPMAIIALIILVQMTPLFIGVVISSAANLTQFANAGVEQMLFAAAVFLLFSLSIYWVIGSIFALIIVTNQNSEMIVYPSQAVKIAGDMVIQRRLSVLLRMIWCAFVLSLIWIVVLIPAMLIINWLGSFVGFVKYLPVVQVLMVILTAFSLVFAAVYLYTLYRKIIDNDRKI